MAKQKGPKDPGANLQDLYNFITAEQIVAEKIIVKLEFTSTALIPRYGRQKTAWQQAVFLLKYYHAKNLQTQIFSPAMTEPSCHFQNDEVILGIQLITIVLIAGYPPFGRA